MGVGMRLGIGVASLVGALAVGCAAGDQTNQADDGNGVGATWSTSAGGAGGAVTTTGAGGTSHGGASSGGASSGGASSGGSGGASNGGSGGAGGQGLGGSGGAGGGCAAPMADCNGDPKDGCEVDLGSDPLACGDCKTVCPALPNAKPACDKGQCTFNCEDGWANCDAMPANGCEVSTLSDPNDCGACGKVCPSGPNAQGVCQGGTCALLCPPNLGDCDGNAANGCEQSLLSDPKNCGACHKDCGGSACVQGSCACASETQSANPVPLDLFIMLDRSSSMSDLVVGGGTRWDAVTQALEAFFADPKNASLGVGLQYFALPYTVPPPDNCNTDADCGGYAPCVFFSCDGNGGGTDSCDPADYAKADVEIAPLGAAQQAALKTSIGKHQPQHDTPTAPALEGALQHASTWAVAHPSHVVAVVLATDGKPTECTVMDPAAIGQIAAKAYGATPSIRTFVIGVGPSLAALDKIAAGGGTGSAFLVDSNANVLADFEAALDKIHAAAIGCEYSIPVPKQGPIDYAKVNVEYQPGNGGAPTLFSNVANAAACDPVTGGWYYDDPNQPTKILLCSASCNAVQSDAKATVEVVLGCATIHK
jgi:hypothetical protein